MAPQIQKLVSTSKLISSHIPSYCKEDQEKSLRWLCHDCIQFGALMNLYYPVTVNNIKFHEINSTYKHEITIL